MSWLSLPLLGIITRKIIGINITPQRTRVKAKNVAKTLRLVGVVTRVRGFFFFIAIFFRMGPHCIHFRFFRCIFLQGHQHGCF